MSLMKRGAEPECNATQIVHQAGEDTAADEQRETRLPSVQFMIDTTALYWKGLNLESGIPDPPPGTQLTSTTKHNPDPQNTKYGNPTDHQKPTFKVETSETLNFNALS